MTCPDCAIWRDRYQREHIALKAMQDRLDQLQAANEARDHRPTGWFNFEDPKPATPHLVGPTQPHAAMSQWIGERTSQPTQPRRRK